MTDSLDREMQEAISTVSTGKLVNLSVLKAFLDEVHDSTSPASAALFVIGLMSGEIARQTGSEHFMGLMRMIVAIDDQHPDKREQDHEEIAALAEKLKAKYLAKVESTA